MRCDSLRVILIEMGKTKNENQVRVAEAVGKTMPIGPDMAAL